MAQTLSPSDDAHVDSAFPSTNFGNSPFLEVGGTSQAFIRFDLSSLPAGSGTGVGSKVNLVLWVNRIGTAGSIEVSEANGSWSESAVTSSSEPLAGTAVGPITTAAGSSFVSIDVTGSFQKWIANPSLNQGFVLSGTGSTDIFLDSKESVTTSHPATLQLIQAGPIGPIGAMGPQGLQGATGATGAPGIPGSNGISTVYFSSAGTQTAIPISSNFPDFSVPALLSLTVPAGSYLLRGSTSLYASSGFLNVECWVYGGTGTTFIGGTQVIISAAGDIASMTTETVATYTSATTVKFQCETGDSGGISEYPAISATAVNTVIIQ